MTSVTQEHRPDLATRLEHQMDARSVGFAAWLYRRTRGRIARLYRRRVLVLTTTGRRTGTPRAVVVQYFPDGDDLVVVAANSGMPDNPAWYHNLRASPRARVEIDGRSMEVDAEQLTEADAAAFWPRVIEAAPDYARFPVRTDRSIPLMRLRPVDPTTADQPDEERPGIYRSVALRDAVVDRYEQLTNAWPVELRELDVPTSGAMVHVLDSGPVDGPPVLLLHAASMSATSWAPNVGALARAGYRTFAVDHPGEANRSVLTDPTRFPRDDAAVAALYAEVLDALGVRRCAVVGASAGAQRALRLTLANPERVSHLALVGPMGLTPLRPGAIVRMMLAAMRPTARRIRSTARWALGTNPAVVERFGPWFELAVEAVAPPPPVARPTATPTRELATVTAPTLVVLGDDDPLAGPPARAAARAAHLPDVTIRVVPSGHLVNIEQADEVNRLLLDGWRDQR
jgi:deazaflavin-dependent oxidoreductase (nitroreductase family)